MTESIHIVDRSPKLSKKEIRAEALRLGIDFQDEMYADPLWCMLALQNWFGNHDGRQGEIEDNPRRWLGTGEGRATLRTQVALASDVFHEFKGHRQTLHIITAESGTPLPYLTLYSVVIVGTRDPRLDVDTVPESAVRYRRTVGQNTSRAFETDTPYVRGPYEIFSANNTQAAIDGVDELIDK